MTTLVAGFGNIFFSDDGFGPAVIRALKPDEFPSGVRVRDFGTGGMYLALELLSGYHLAIIVDAIARDDPPGTVFAIEPQEALANLTPSADPHAMDVRSVLTLYEQMCAHSPDVTRPKVLIAGCVPQTLDPGMDLSEPVRAAVPTCTDLISRLAHEASGFPSTGVEV